MNQTERILNHLKQGREITPLEALYNYGVFRLGARIWELREQGYQIKSTIIKKGKKHFASYKLEGN